MPRWHADRALPHRRDGCRPEALCPASCGEDLREAGRTALISSTAICAGLFSLILGATVYVVTNIDDTYRRVLEGVRGGYRGALLPYKQVGLLSLLGFGCGLGGIFAWHGFAPGEKEAAIVATFAFTLWAAIGTVQLVFLTMWHGEQRVRLFGIAHKARRELRKRQTEVTTRGRR